ncbi:DUF3325 domain-containing protein [Uliginosibacterium paludis]|uniref:DUF3325 domain-containing protein n=1 Tax=Uliginosibacterium paludis TaxID=1615952 RepID=A0ABV2CRW5_9RHOO
MMALASFVLLFIGLEALCLGMDRHARQLAGSTLPGPLARCARVLGCMALLGSAMLEIAQRGLSIGLTAWFGLLTLAAMTLVLALSYRPAWLGARLIRALLGRAFGSGPSARP